MRNLFSLRPLALFLGTVLLLMAPLAGCKSGASLSANLLPYGERTRLADEAITQAISAFDKGDQAKGDAFLHRAVILLTSSASEEFNDEGFIAVAQRIAASGRPNDAMRLLDPLTQDKRVSGDPRLWGAIADAAKKAANTGREKEARARAEQEADKIVAQFGTATPKTKEAQKLSLLATYAGQYYSEFGNENYGKALAAYREAYRLMPDDLIVKNNLGYMLADHGTQPQEFEEAVRLTREIVEKDPNNPFYLYSFGWALYKRGNEKERDVEGARRRLREAVDLAPNIAECRYHLAVVYEKLSLLPDALREAESAVRIQPDFMEAKALVENLKPRVAALPSPTPSPEDSPTPLPSPSASAKQTATPSPQPSGR